MMAMMDFLRGLQSPDTVSYWCEFYVLGCLFVLRALSIAGRPVAHPDRKNLASQHKAAEAERVEILERLIGGSKPSDAQLQGGGEDLRLDLKDVEKEPLCSPLLASFMKEANEAMITLTRGTRAVSSSAFESMKEISEAAASGELADKSVVYNSERTMVQTKVELQDGIYERLKDLMKTRTSTTTAPLKESTTTLQLDNWAILKPSDKGVDLLRLPIDEVPVILHAEYAAGLLTITGLNLEDASILLSAQNAYGTVQLKVWRFLKATSKKSRECKKPWGRCSRTEEDIVTLPTRLSWNELEDVFVYATKKVQLGVEGQSVEAISKAVRITDSLWRTVLGLWIPCIALWILFIYNLKLLLGLPNGLLSAILSGIVGVNGSWMVFWFFLLFHNPSSSLVEFVKYHLETIHRGFGQALLLVYYGFESLKGPRLKFASSDGRSGFSSPSPFPIPPPPVGTVRSRHRVEPVAPYSSEGSAGAKSVNDPTWQWPAFDDYEGKNGKVELKRCSEKAPDDVSPFQVMYRRRKQQLWPDVVEVDLISAPLIKIVQKYLPQNGDLQSLATPKLNGRDLFTVLADLKNHQVSISCADSCNDNPHVHTELDINHDTIGQLHLRHLIRFMDKEYNEVAIRLRRMTEEGRVAWDMLWTFLTPGKKVVYICDHTQEVLAAVVSKNNYTIVIKKWVFVVDLDVWDYDGKTYRKCQIQRIVSKFDGEVAFSSLPVRPSEIEGAPEILEAGFLAKGKRFYELTMNSSHRFMQYSGPMFQVRRENGTVGLVKENADGRVMIDLASFAKMNPGYKMGNAKPPAGVFRAPADSPGNGRKAHPRFEENQEMLDLAQPGSESVVADETLIFAPAIVYGFSFTLKQWGSFAVGGFSEICFSTNAFDALVMESDSKELVYKLVSQYIATPVDPSLALERVDPIARKGEGCIFVCYGPPGTGKTLTAESVAESMHRPLWALSASELGGTSSNIEKTLLEVLDIAVSWRAVLLIDEADYFLQKRSSGTGATTGVFLRFLEYYRGVLFLTTNRIGTFDDAFRSRISMFLRYPKLSVQQKEQIWTALLNRARVAGITADFVSEVAAENLNGREIRNSIHTAQILAKCNGETFDQSHVRHVTRVMVSSLSTLTATLETTGGNDVER